MQIIINIPTEHYNEIVYEDIEKLRECVRNGVPIPKGHGRLGDLDRLQAKIFNACIDKYFMPVKSLTCDDVTDIIDDVPTIIEADKECD